MIEKVSSDRLLQMNTHLNTVGGIRHGEARCEKCKDVYPAGAPHGCRFEPTKKTNQINHVTGNDF